MPMCHVARERMHRPAPSRHPVRSVLSFSRFPPDCRQFVVTLRVMSAFVSCRIEQLSSANAACVYDVLMDFDHWSDWMPTVSSASWEVRGAPETGVGGIRRVRVGLSVTHDRIVEGMRPHHHAYAVALPWYVPLKDYRGDVRIEDRPTGCLIIWTATCASRIPGLVKIFQSSLRATYTRVAAALAQEAERSAP
jgi:Polyketide cyclase / dehydrase and lipid transport